MIPAPYSQPVMLDSQAHRQKRLRTGLEQQERITDAFHDAGFGSSGRFYENAPKLLGMTPKLSK